MRATESDPRVTELYNESTPFLDAYPDYDLALLPTWVRENIEAARVYGGSKRGVVLPDGRKYHLDNKLNDLTGREWTFFINSVFFHTLSHKRRGSIRASYKEDSSYAAVDERLNSLFFKRGRIDIRFLYGGWRHSFGRRSVQ